MTSPSTPKVALGPALQSYFYSYLIGQRDASPRTITSYRDTFRLLLRFLQQQGLQPDKLCVDDLDADRVLAFLADLEKSRGNCARSRNARLAAIRSFLRHATSANPLLLPITQRVLAIPMKRFDRPTFGHLTREQMQAVLDSPNTATWSGQRDQLLLMLLYNTGARVSEIVGLKIKDVRLESQASVHLLGKGRKHRAVPLWRKTTRLLQSWLKRSSMAPDSSLLPNSRGEPMSRSGVAQRLRVAVTRAAAKCPALQSIRVSPHTIRHTTAMHLLQSGVDLSTIAMWLGHESIVTTHQYLAADLESKRQALSLLEAPRMRKQQGRPAKSVMDFLEQL